MPQKRLGNIRTDHIRLQGNENGNPKQEDYRMSVEDDGNLHIQKGKQNSENKIEYVDQMIIMCDESGSTITPDENNTKIQYTAPVEFTEEVTFNDGSNNFTMLSLIQRIEQNEATIASLENQLSTNQNNDNED